MNLRFEITLSPLQQRSLALGLALLVLAGALAGVVSFVAAQMAHHRRVELLVRELATERAILEQESEWRAKLSAVKTSSDWRGLFLGEVKLEQQGYVAQLVAKHGGTVQRSSLTRLDAGTATEIDEHISFTADIGALTHVLYDLRGPAPLLVIRRLEIHDSEPPSNLPRTAPNKLRVEMTVAGFAAPP